MINLSTSILDASNTQNQQWGGNISDLDLSCLGQHLLAIIGPSGAGKTAIATALTRTLTCAYFLPVYTTRATRDDDVPGHYWYIDDKEFLTLAENGHFLIFRKSPFPRYGWRRDDLMAAVSTDKVPIMLFRHGGARVLLDILPTAMLVFIEPRAEIATEKSSGRAKMASEISTETIILENGILRECAIAKQWPVLTLQNEFLGSAELESHASSVFHWVQECVPGLARIKEP